MKQTGHVNIADGGNAITVDGTVSANATLSAETTKIIGTVNVAAAQTIAVTNSDITSIKTAVEILDNAIAGTEMQVDVLTQPARDRLTDNVGVALQTDVMMSDTTAITPKFAVISAASAGDNTIVAAVAGKKIRVLSYTLVNNHTAVQTCRWESGAAGTAVSGHMIFGANGGATPAFNPCGLFETGVNTLLNLELAGATAVGGHLTYIEV